MKIYRIERNIVHYMTEDQVKESFGMKDDPRTAEQMIIDQLKGADNLEEGVWEPRIVKPEFHNTVTEMNFFFEEWEEMKKKSQK